MAMLTCDYLHSLFLYNPETGELFRKERPLSHFKTEMAGRTWNTRFANKIVSATDKDGYLFVGIDYRRYTVHNIAYMMMTGEWPKQDMDHKDRTRTNNKWSNLRDATRSQNMRNTKVYATSSSGVKGVTPHGKRWMAKINHQKKQIYLGIFPDMQSAIESRRKAEKALHGEYRAA
jgi:hypothetical protein